MIKKFNFEYERVKNSEIQHIPSYEVSFGMRARATNTLAQSFIADIELQYLLEHRPDPATLQTKILCYNASHTCASLLHISLKFAYMICVTEYRSVLSRSSHAGLDLRTLLDFTDKLYFHGNFQSFQMGYDLSL